MRHLKMQLSNLRRGFTLVELLIVISIITIVTAIALPTVRDQLRDQKAKRAASLVQAYIDTARARAVNTGKPYGVVIKRWDTDGFGSCRSIELRYCRLASSYAGDDSTAFASIDNPDPNMPKDPNFPTRIVTFPAASGNDVIRTPPKGFIVPGDVISFGISRNDYQVQRLNFNSATPPQLVSMQVEIVDGSRDVDFDNNTVPSTPYSISRFRETSSLPLNLMRGTMIDLTFSGYRRGDASVQDYSTAFSSHQRLSACQFSPMEIEHRYDVNRGATATSAYAAGSAVFDISRSYDYGDIWILFSPDGTVYSVMYAEVFGPTGGKQTRMRHHLVNSDIYLMVGLEGKTDPQDPLSLSSKEQATPFDPQSVWVVINGVSGEVTTQIPLPITNARDSVLQAVEKTPPELHNGISKLMHLSREKI